MSASLVGSEMCIRDRCPVALWPPAPPRFLRRAIPPCWARAAKLLLSGACLLYTSDAADDM
eukprot:1444175-Alexandrium_andersonii.AAC.1